MTTDTDAGARSHIVRWEEEHPVIAELRSRPGQWAVIWEDENSRIERRERETLSACNRHPCVEVDGEKSGEGMMIRHRARWVGLR